MHWSEFYDTAGRLAQGATDFQIVLAALPSMKIVEGG